MGSYKQTLVMKSLTVVMVLVASVTARPDGPGGHHHHGDHGAHHATHHGAHHADHHGGGHHATHGVQHAPLTTVNLGSSHHVQSPVHTVHSVQPVHSSFSIQPESVHTPESVQQPNVVAPVVVKNSPKSIADLVSTNPKFSTLLTAVKAAGLVDTLAGPGPFTVFAPTNTAFDKVPVEALNGLLADKEALKKTFEARGARRHHAGKEHSSWHHYTQNCLWGGDYSNQGQIHSAELQCWQCLCGAV